MLKKRIVPIMLLSNGRLVKGRQFSAYRDVGDPVKSAAVYNSQLADELVIININQGQGIAPLLAIVDKLSRVCFMPLTLGGGIRSLDDGAALIMRGADKILVNSLCYRDLGVITALSQRFGKQAVICAVDARWHAEQQCYRLYSECGSMAETISLEQHIEALIKAGAGEILIQSIDHDGSMQGYDLNLIHQVQQHAGATPLLAAGGSGNYDHLKELFLTSQVDAAICGSLFNFSDSNPLRAKAYLLNYNIPLKKV